MSVRDDVAQAWHELNCETAANGQPCKVGKNHAFMADATITRLVALTAKDAVRQASQSQLMQAILSPEQEKHFESLSEWAESEDFTIPDDATVVYGTQARMVAMCRLLVADGHMTPIAERQILKTLAVELGW